MTKLKCWVKAYNSKSKSSSAIFANYKKHLWIQRAGKQLGQFDNFKSEKFPVLVQSTGGKEVETKWFSDKDSADKYLKDFMKRNRC